MSLYPDYDPHQEKLIRELERAHGAQPVIFWGLVPKDYLITIKV
jgi:hypothetical protein